MNDMYSCTGEQPVAVSAARCCFIISATETKRGPYFARPASASVDCQMVPIAPMIAARSASLSDRISRRTYLTTSGRDDHIVGRARTLGGRGVPFSPRDARNRRPRGAPPRRNIIYLTASSKSELLKSPSAVLTFIVTRNMRPGSVKLRVTPG